MKRIVDLVGNTELVWTKPDWRTLRYELRDGADCLAALAFRRATGSLATAQSGDGCWTFRRSGFLQTHVTIRPCGASEDIAIFMQHAWTGGGTLVFQDERRFTAHVNLWSSAFSISTEAGEPLVRYRRRFRAMRLSATMELEPATGALAELPWIAMLGWYLAVQLHRDSALYGSSS